MVKPLLKVGYALIMANAIALPLHASGSYSTPPSLGKSPCEERADICSGTAGHQHGGGAPPSQELMDPPVAPTCPDCTAELRVWYFCKRDQPEPPARCQLWKHKFKVFHCPGATYYNCDGYNWELVGTDCSVGETTCSMQNPENLPLGCVPPVNHSWVYCQRARE